MCAFFQLVDFHQKLLYRYPISEISRIVQYSIHSLIWGRVALRIYLWFFENILYNTCDIIVKLLCKFWYFQDQLLWTILTILHNFVSLSYLLFQVILTFLSSTDLYFINLTRYIENPILVSTWNFKSGENSMFSK